MLAAKTTQTDSSDSSQHHPRRLMNTARSQRQGWYCGWPPPCTAEKSWALQVGWLARAAGLLSAGIIPATRDLTRQLPPIASEIENESGLNFAPIFSTRLVLCSGAGRGQGPRAQNSSKTPANLVPPATSSQNTIGLQEGPAQQCGYITKMPVLEQHRTLRHMRRAAGP